MELFGNKKRIVIFVLTLVIVLLGVGWYYSVWQGEVKQEEAEKAEETLSSVQNATTLPAPFPVSPTPSVEATNTSATKLYRNEEWGFEFEYPGGWTLHPILDPFRGPFSKFQLAGVPAEKEYLIYRPDLPFLINIVTPEFVDRQFYNLRNVATEIMVDGAIGLKYKYKEQISYITVILPLGQYKMILGTTKAYGAIFDQILASFKFFESARQKE